jgi:uncharacterized protein YbjT (DUF2867 family)
MRVVVIGAYGLVGAYATAWLNRRGHGVVGAGRDAAAARRLPIASWFSIDFSARPTARQWQALLEGADAVVNCAGALQDSPRDDLAAVHLAGPMALYRACVAAGVRRIVHVSAVGVAADRPTAFSTTKFEAEAALRQLDIDWVILRPGLVLAPTAYGGSALLRGLAGFPLFMPVVHAASPVQVVSVEDVAEAVVRAVEAPNSVRGTYDLVAAEPTPLAEVLTRLRAWLGLPVAPLWNVPPMLAALTAAGADVLAYLGWRSPLRSTSMAQLRQGVLGNPAAARHALGLECLSLAEMLARWPSGVQERRFAKLYFVKPLALATLALFWLVSGLLGLAERSPAAALLTASGWPSFAANLFVVAGALLDLALGVLVCFRRAAPAALLGMVFTSLAYVAGGSLTRADLWLDPLGPFVKIVPGTVLALATLAMMDER